MKVIFVAADSSTDRREFLGWPHEWRIPVKGDAIRFQPLDVLTRTVRDVCFVREVDQATGAVFYSVEICLDGPAFDANT